MERTTDIKPRLLDKMWESCASLLFFASSHMTARTICLWEYSKAKKSIQQCEKSKSNKKVQFHVYVSKCIVPQLIFSCQTSRSVIEQHHQTFNHAWMLFLILNVRVMMKSDWDLHLCWWLPGTSGNGYESLHRGNIPIPKIPIQKSFSLDFLFSFAVH